MTRNLNTRRINPKIINQEIWPGPNDYPWKDSGMRLWTREGLLRRTGPNGLIATWTTGGFSDPAPGNFTMIALSDDNGTTWQDGGRFEHPWRGLFTTELFVPRPNEIHAFLQTYEFGEWMSRLESCRTVSTDGGRTWTTPHSIPGGIHNVWVNRGIVAASGRWVIPVSWAEHLGEEWGRPGVGRSPSPCRIGKRDGAQTVIPVGADSGLIYSEGNNWCHRNHRYACGVMLSDDGGATFRKQGYLCSGPAGRLIEPRVVELADGKLVMLLRSLDESWLWRSESVDGGETWSAAVRGDIPNPSAKVNILKARDGRIFMIHNPVDTGCSGGLFSMNARNPLSLWVSHDDMNTWDIKVDLVKDANPHASLNYPDGYLNEDTGEIDLCWEDAYSVYRMRIPMDIMP